MGKDTGWKDYFSDNRRYADLINGLAFEGDRLIMEEDMQELDTQSRGFGGKPQMRDVVRKVAFGVNFAVIGIESQETIDYAIALRNMAYDAGEYEKQAAKIRRMVREHPEGLSAGEYLYGFRRDSRLHPVVSIILYAGVEEWDGPKSLHGMLDFTDMPDRMRELVQDYRIHLIEIRKWTDTSVFQTDVRQVFDFIRCAEDKGALKKLVDSDPYYRAMEEDAYDVVTCYAHAEELIGRKDHYRKDGKVNMCTAIREMMADSRAEGKALGLSEGKALGLSEGKALMEEKTRRMIENMIQREMSDEDIMAIAECERELVIEIRTGWKK